MTVGLPNGSHSSKMVFFGIGEVFIFFIIQSNFYLKKGVDRVHQSLQIHFTLLTVNRKLHFAVSMFSMAIKWATVYFTAAAWTCHFWVDSFDKVSMFLYQMKIHWRWCCWFQAEGTFKSCIFRQAVVMVGKDVCENDPYIWCFHNSLLF